ncbi:MAG: hypothetical protein ACJAXY_001034 [Nonlabens sp.]|jgi:hypothetical protein
MDPKYLKLEIQMATLYGSSLNLTRYRDKFQKGLKIGFTFKIESYY